MPRLLLVRHGQAAAGWDQDHDPGLDPAGAFQAQAWAQGVEGPARPIVVSPLRRTRETAAALEARWGVIARVEPAVGEIPSPTDDLAQRGAWLRSILRGTWSAQPPELLAWRDSVIAALVALPEDTVVVTHFVAINAAVGAATGDDRLVCFNPGYCSATLFDVDGAALRAVALGDEASTEVN